MGVYSFVELMGTGELAFMEQKWRRVFVSDVSTDYNKRSSDLTYPPQASDLRPDSHQVR